MTGERIDGEFDRFARDLRRRRHVRPGVYVQKKEENEEEGRTTTRRRRVQKERQEKRSDAKSLIQKPS